MLSGAKMTKKTALQLCHGYQGPFFDVAQQHAHSLKNNGFNVVTVFLSGKPDEQKQFHSFSDETIFLNRPSKALKGLKLGLLITLIHLCKTHDISLIVAHRAKPIYLACLIAWLRPKTKVLGIIHAFGVFNRFNRKWMAYCNSKHLILLGVSNAIRDEIRQSLPRFPHNNIQTFYNRLDFNSIKPSLRTRQEARKALNIVDSSYAFVNIGRLHPDKDQKTLIAGFARALPSIDKAHLYIAGQGKLEHTLKKQVNELQLNEKIHFLGNIPEIYRYLNAFDCFVLSSDHEPFGMVLLEAIAAEIPIITTKCGGANEIVIADTKFNVGDTKTLSKLLLQQQNEKPEITINKSKQQLNFAKKNFSYEAAIFRFSEIEKLLDD